MRICTWNVNSVRLRLDGLKRLTQRLNPEILCLQEIKAEEAQFPGAAIAELGYSHVEIAGFKGYNGVAVLARRPVTVLGYRDWCGRADGRYLGIAVSIDSAAPLQIHNFYVPAGGDVPDPERNAKFAHKLSFLEEMAAWGGEEDAVRRVLTGDLNIAPLESDVWSHKQLLKVVSHTPVEVERLGTAQRAGSWHDAVRAVIPPDQKLFSWWSYRARDWSASDRGRRLDHIWVSPDLVPAIRGAEVLREARGWERPSDHVPVAVDLEFQ